MSAEENNNNNNNNNNSNNIINNNNNNNNNSNNTTTSSSSSSSNNNNDNNNDISNLLSTLHTDSSPPSAAPLDRHHHLPSINATIFSREIPSHGLSFQLWPSALSFLSFLSLSPLPPSSAPLRLLELGSGTGLAGISAAALLRAHVTLTDLPHVLPNLQFNATQNSPLVAARGGALAVKQLRWGVEEDAVEIGREEVFDAVIASDVVYYEHLIQPLIETVRVFVKGEVEFFMAHLRRWRRRDALFFRRARRFFDVVVVRRDLPVGGSRTGVVIYRFTARKASALSGN